MNCQRVQRFLSLYHDGHPAGREANAIAAHLRDCPTCHQFREALATLGGNLRSADDAQPASRPDLRSRALDRWSAQRAVAGAGDSGGFPAWRLCRWPVAAAAALLVAALGLAWWQQGGRNAGKSANIVHYAPVGPTIPTPHSGLSHEKSRPRTRVARGPLLLHGTRRRSSEESGPQSAGVPRLSGFGGAPSLTGSPGNPGTRSTARHAAPVLLPPSTPGLPDPQYLDGRNPSLLARWNAVDDREQARLRAILSKLPPPADDFVQIPFPRIAAAGDAGIAAAAREYKQQAKVVDARLFRKVTLQDKGVSLADFCTELQVQTGVRLSATRTVADEKVTVFLKEEPTRDIMRAVTHLFGYSWLRSGHEGEYRYELDQDLRSQLAEQELRNQDQDGALLALDVQMQKYRPFVGMSFDELEKLSDQSRANYMLLFKVMHNAQWGGMQLYYRLTPRDRAALAAGQELVFRPDAADPDHRLPTEWNRSILRSWDTNVRINDQPVELADVPGIKVNQVLLKLNRSELGQVTLAVTTAADWPGSRTHMPEEMATGRSPSVASPDNATVNAALRNQSPFDQVVSVAPEPSCPADKNYRQTDMDLDLDLVFFNFDLSQPHALSADAWEAVHRATGLPIIADFYTRLYPLIKLTVQGKPLFDALCSVGDGLGTRWRKDGDFLLCRSASYFWDKLKEVPNRHLQRWARDRDANGGLPLADFLEMAAMPDSQLDSAAVAQGIEHYWKLPEWGLLNYEPDRHTARLLSTLAPEQLQRTLQPDGLPFKDLTPAQQRGAMQVQFELNAESEREGGGPTSIPPDHWPHAMVTVEYVPARWYAWIAPRAVRYGDWNGPRRPFGGRTAVEALAAARQVYPPASPRDVRLARGGHFRAGLMFVFHGD